jgi:hypothetical protein
MVLGFYEFKRLLETLWILHSSELRRELRKVRSDAFRRNGGASLFLGGWACWSFFLLKNGNSPVPPEGGTTYKKEKPRNV